MFNTYICSSFIYKLKRHSLENLLQKLKSKLVWSLWISFMFFVFLFEMKILKIFIKKYIVVRFKILNK